MRSKERKQKCKKNWKYFLKDWCLLKRIVKIKYQNWAVKIVLIKKEFWVKINKMSLKTAQIKKEYWVKIDKVNKIDIYIKMKTKKKKYSIRCGDKMLNVTCLNCHK
jgi:nicotinic acid phosphoribosyltransferase